MVVLLTRKYHYNDRMHANRLFSSLQPILQTSDSKETYRTAATQLLSLFDGMYCSSFERKKQSYERTYTNHVELYNIKPRNNGIASRVFHNRKPFVSLKRECPPSMQHMDFSSLLVVPLYHERNLLGHVTVIHKNLIRLNPDLMKNLSLFALYTSSIIMQNITIEEQKRSIDQYVLSSSIISHEMRTHLTVVNSYAQLIADRIPRSELLCLEWKMKLKQGMHQCDRLLQETLESQTSPLLHKTETQCSLSNIVILALEATRMIYGSYRFIIKNVIKTSDVIIGDEDKLFQAVVNILHNAAKFSPQHMPINIYLRTSISKLNTVELTVMNRGASIPKAHLPYICRRFYKLNKKKPGKGLGLFLVKNIVSKHHGMMNIISSAHKGTRVTLSFPTV